MKRILAVLAVLGCAATIACAATNEVTSVNIVGYNKVDIPDNLNFNMVAVQFDAFDPTLLGVFGTNQLQAGVFPTLADRVYIYDPSLGNGGGYRQYAMKSPNMEFFDTGEFFDPNASSTNPPIPAGTGMWIQRAQNAPSNEVVTAGEVVDVGTQSVDIVEGFQILGYPYSAEVALNDTELKNQATPGVFPSLADRIYVWNGSGYDQYALKQMTGSNEWFRAEEFFDPQKGPTTDKIPMGGGFWYEAKSDFEWQERIPYKDALK